MRILFQGGWKKNRDSEEIKYQVVEYCKKLAQYIVQEGHEIILTSTRDFDKMIAEEIVQHCKANNLSPKKNLLFLLSDKIQEIPKEGKVKKFSSSSWWFEERTYFIQNSDALIAIGGGRGTFDCLEKAILSGKPVFVATGIQSISSKVWKNRKMEHYYIEKGDAEFLEDVNITADEFFTQVFQIIQKLGEMRYSRRIFIVHGRDHHFKDSLVKLLEELKFDPIVLQEEPSESLTIIEKLERDISKVGFGFVLYTPDDLGHLPGEPEKPRARQNVIFEHGLLIGALGRSRTCAIFKGDLEIPSDIQGMVYERVDDFVNEKSKIIKVLKQVGYQM